MLQVFTEVQRASAAVLRLHLRAQGLDVLKPDIQAVSLREKFFRRSSKGTHGWIGEYFEMMDGKIGGHPCVEGDWMVCKLKMDVRHMIDSTSTVLTEGLPPLELDSTEPTAEGGQLTRQRSARIAGTALHRLYANA